MNKSMAELRELRLQKLFDDCQNQVISQIIGPFGLSLAMFEDKDGGNIATVYNAEKSIFPDEKHEKNYEIANEGYSQKIRQENLDDASARGKTHKKNNEAFDSGQEVLSDVTKKPMVQGEIDGDHTVSLNEIHGDKDLHLRFSEEERKRIANSEKNMAYIEASLNRSKGKRSWEECLNDPAFVEKNNLTPDDIKRIKAIDKEARSYIKKEKNKKLAEEVLVTGAEEAVRMGLRQALGVLLTELVNGLFNEFKILIKQGVELGKTIFQEIHERLTRVVDSVVKKVPDAIGQFFAGGISGFMTNLLTFLINNFITTAKRFVTMIREGFLGIIRAIKMIFFPPKNMTNEQALQEGLKILTITIVTVFGFALESTISTFVASIPVLGSIADLITPVLIGIMTGLLSALLAYQIDRVFDRNSFNEKFMDELLLDATRRDKFADELAGLTQISIGNIDNYSKSIALYERIGETFKGAAVAATATSDSLHRTITQTGEQIAKSFATIEYINKTQPGIDDFCNKL